MVGARRATGVSHAAADPLGISLHLNRSQEFTGSVSENESINYQKHVLQPATRGIAVFTSRFLQKVGHTENLKFNPTRLGFPVIFQGGSAELV